MVSIGNITTGGTGTTPAAIYFSRLLATEGHRVGILSRGYGGSMVKEGGVLSDGEDLLLSPAQGGDEPYLLAVNLPGIQVAVGRKRFDMGRALQERYGNDLFVLDDGFQHYALARDVDIVLVDATNPFGNGQLLPHGILREPISALERADIVILTKCDLADSMALADLQGHLEKASGRETIFRSRHAPTGLVKLPIEYNFKNVAKKPAKTSLFDHEEVWALSAIGNHRAFEKTLLELGASKVESITYRDHHDYSERDVEAILKRVSPYQFLITTEKDWIRLKKYKDEFAHLKNFYYLKIEFEIMSNEVLLKEGLKAKLLSGKQS